MNPRLRLMAIEDISQAVRLSDIAGWNQTTADWERFLSANRKGCFAAECEGRIVGTSATIIYEGRFAWIGMVVVDPQHRGQGVGTLLLERAIQHLDLQRVPCVKLDATPQGEPLYRKFGFVSEYGIERWMLNRPTHLVAGKSQLKRRANESVVGIALMESEDVMRLDREVFGASRSGLLRSLIDAAPDFALAARQATSIDGYALGRRGARADHLGPWIARNQEVAAMLLDEFLHRSGRELVFVDCLGRNPWAVPMLKARGFAFSRPLTRMFRGANNNPGRPELLCAVLGPEFG